MKQSEKWLTEITGCFLCKYRKSMIVLFHAGVYFHKMWLLKKKCFHSNERSIDIILIVKCTGNYLWRLLKVSMIVKTSIYWEMFVLHLRSMWDSKLVSSALLYSLNKHPIQKDKQFHWWDCILPQGYGLYIIVYYFLFAEFGKS